MVASIELQVISKLLVETNEEVIQRLLQFDLSFYELFQPQIKFIHAHYDKYGQIPDVFTFQAEFPDITIVQVNESIEYLESEMRHNKQHIMLLHMFNKIKDLDPSRVEDAWMYIYNQSESALQLNETSPMDIVHDTEERSEEIIQFNQQSRVPTGFGEIDKLMYGGLSTVEELVIIFARTNTGKSWVCTKIMESAHSHGFPVLYYSPEMRASLLATRFDTWKKQFRNSELQQGKYSQAYLEYLDELSKNPTPAFVLEDTDVMNGNVNVRLLENLVKRHNIKVLIIDGLSYMEDTHKSDTDYVKYKNICIDLFKLSKQCGCAVIVAMQANRETKYNTSGEDGKDPWPNLYNLEGSDHPARICTQAFALRQVYDKHILDIRLEKSRNAANQKPVFSYSWDPNTGNMQILQDGDSPDYDTSSQPSMISFSNYSGVDSATANLLADMDDEDEEVEF